MVELNGWYIAGGATDLQMNAWRDKDRWTFLSIMLASLIVYVFAGVDIFGIGHWNHSQGIYSAPGEPESAGRWFGSTCMVGRSEYLRVLHYHPQGVDWCLPCWCGRWWEWKLVVHCFYTILDLTKYEWPLIYWVKRSWRWQKHKKQWGSLLLQPIGFFPKYSWRRKKANVDKSRWKRKLTLTKVKKADVEEKDGH